LASEIKRQVQKAFERLESFYQSELPPSELQAKLLAELNLALHELQAAALELLRQNNEIEEERSRYQDLFDFAPDGYLVTDGEGVIIEANLAATQLFKVSRALLIGKPLAMFVRYEDRLQFRTRLAEKKAGNVLQSDNWELYMTSSQREPFPVSLTVGNVVTSSGKTSELRWLLRDITESKKIEEALRLSEQMFAKAFHNNQTPMAISTLNNVFIDVNSCFAEMLGCNPEDMLGKSVQELNLWFDIEESTKMCNLLSEKGFFRDFECKFKDKSGDIGFCLGSGSLINFNGEQCVIYSEINITDRKKNEDALRKSKELFYKAVNSNPLPMVISTKNGTIVEVNEAYSKKFGYPREEIIGINVADTSIWVDIKERDEYIAKIEEKGFVENYEVIGRNKSGGLFNFLMSGVSIVWNNEPCILAIANDITELRHYQQEMARLDQLNLVGEMSAGIGHEIRNPMTTIRGFLQLLGVKERYAQDKEFMDLMIEELDRVNAIITEYLTLAKDKAVELKRQSLNQKVRTILPLLQADAIKQEKNIEVELGDIPHIVIDRNEIKQLLFNLVRNGLEAMSPGGLLSIKTFQDDSGVVLAVQDQGTGIAPEVLAKIGTPFFTTKDNGTGLGVAVCYSIAQRNNAKVEIDTGVTGTTFYVRFKA